MREIEVFTLTSSEYFEPLTCHVPRTTYREVIRRLLDPTWDLGLSEIWLTAAPRGEELPAEGFKIHLSATPTNALTVLERAVSVLAHSRVPFKVLADEELLYVVNSKPYRRGSSGKFLTAYPASEELFIAAMAQLHELTKELAGPYILSDRRYPGSRILFYRYGGFRGLTQLQLDGHFGPVMRSPTGEPEPDERAASFFLPTWIKDPFPPEPPVQGSEPGLLKGRYKIDSAISFSNGGGIYRARDQHTGAAVLIKEARPLTCCLRTPKAGGQIDATEILKKEHRILQRLEKVAAVPKALDLFYEWEHLFLVQELFPGTPLSHYRSRSDVILIPHQPDESRHLRFCQTFHRIATNLLRVLDEIHAEGVILGDLSPSNVLINTETLDLFIIDFESAQDSRERRDHDSPLLRIHTPGFGTVERMQRTELLVEDDLLAAGMVLYSLITPVQPLFILRPEAMTSFLEDIEKHVGLPSEVGAIIWALLGQDQTTAREHLASWQIESSIRSSLGCLEPRHGPARSELRAEMRARLRSCVDGIAAHLLASYDTERQDRLWPGDVEQFSTNPLSVAHGAGGPLLLLRDLAKPIPEEVLQWIFQAIRTVDRFPPSLYLGLAGIAQIFAEIGFDSRALEVLTAAAQSPLLLKSPDYFHGAAGWGLCQLWFARRCEESTFRDQALQAGDQILAMAERREQQLFWRQELDQKVHFGLGYGASGIALFLAHLFAATGEERFRLAARQGLAFEIASADRAQGNVLRWRNYQGESDIVIPYWRHGGAGIASALVRCAGLLSEPSYLEIAGHIVRDVHSRYAVHPSQFEGLAGIGEAELDLFLATGDERFLDMAYDTAEGILLYAIERAEGIAFPGRYLLRLSTDFGTGSSGIGAFFHRLLHPGPRRFHDLEPVVRG